MSLKKHSKEAIADIVSRAVRVGRVLALNEVARNIRANIARNAPRHPTVAELDAFAGALEAEATALEVDVTREISSQKGRH